MTTQLYLVRDDQRAPLKIAPGFDVSRWSKIPGNTGRLVEVTGMNVKAVDKVGASRLSDDVAEEMMRRALAQRDRRRRAGNVISAQIAGRF